MNNCRFDVRSDGQHGAWCLQHRSYCAPTPLIPPPPFLITREEILNLFPSSHNTRSTRGLANPYYAPADWARPIIERVRA